MSYNCVRYDYSKDYMYLENSVLPALNETECWTLCSPSSLIGTAAHSPSSTFGTDYGAMQNELNPIVLHLVDTLALSGA